MKNLFSFKDGKVVFMGKYPIDFVKNDELGTNEYRARPHHFHITYHQGYIIEDGLYKLWACAGSGFRCFLEVRGRRVRISDVSCYSKMYEDHYRDVVVDLKEGKYIFLFGRPVRYSKNTKKF